MVVYQFEPVLFDCLYLEAVGWKRRCFINASMRLICDGFDGDDNGLFACRMPEVITAHQSMENEAV